MLVMSLLFVVSHAGDLIANYISASPLPFNVGFSLGLNVEICSPSLQVIFRVGCINVVVAFMCLWNKMSSGSSYSAIFPDSLLSFSFNHSFRGLQVNILSLLIYFTKVEFNFTLAYPTEPSLTFASVVPTYRTCFQISFFRPPLAFFFLTFFLDFLLASFSLFQDSLEKN